MISFPAPAVAAVALIACGVGSSVTHSIMHNKAVEKELEIYKEAKRRMDLSQEVANEYAEEIAALRERKPRVVRYCPELPTAAGRPNAPGSAEASQRDLGPLLRETYEELLRCNKLREAAK